MDTAFRIRKTHPPLSCGPGSSCRMASGRPAGCRARGRRAPSKHCRSARRPAGSTHSISGLRDQTHKPRAKALNPHLHESNCESSQAHGDAAHPPRTEPLSIREPSKPPPKPLILNQKIKTLRLKSQALHPKTTLLKLSACPLPPLAVVSGLEASVC